MEVMGTAFGKLRTRSSTPLRKAVVALSLFCVLATSCSSDAEPGQAFPEGTATCTGEDPSSGLDLAVSWNLGEVRELSLATSSVGAGVDPRISGAIGTTPITVTAAELAPTGTLLDWVIGETMFDDGSLTEIGQSLPADTIEVEIDDFGAIISDTPPADLIATDVEIYNFVASVADGATITSPALMINPLTASIETATLTLEHLGTDDQGCEVLRATRHIGPEEIIEDLDDLLEELRDPNGRPEAFANIGFEGAVVQTTAYRFDHGIDRLRSVDFTEAWGIFGAGGVDTRVETRVFTDVTDR